MERVINASLPRFCFYEQNTVPISRKSALELHALVFLSTFLYLSHMNKLKSTLLRSNKTTQQPIKKSFDDDSVAIRQATPAVPHLKLSALAEHERLQYFSWWKDLDPFNIGVLDNQSVLSFLQGCQITDDVLEKVGSVNGDATFLIDRVGSRTDA